MDIKRKARETGEDLAKLWVAKKGLEWTGSLLKWSAIAGAGYLSYKYFRRNEPEIREKFHMGSVH